MEIKKFNSVENEFIVEAMNHDGKFKVVGKVLTDNNLLNDDDLDDIWDLANWGTNGLEVEVIKDGTYAGCKAQRVKGLLYVRMDEQVNVVNDNIIVRKHYDMENAYYLKSARAHKGMKHDLWCFGSKSEYLSELKSNPFI